MKAERSVFTTMKKNENRFPLLPKVHQVSGALTDGCLVLEGGGFRGIYTAGVCDVLMEQGIHMQCVAGVSAGALNGMNIISRQVGRYAAISLLHRQDSRYTGWRAWLTDRGLVGFRFLMQSVQQYLPYDAKQLEDPARRFVAVCTDMKTGKPFYAERDNCSSMTRAVSASSSLSFVSRIVRLDGRKLLDGGHAVSVPIAWATEQGYRKRIVVLTRERTFRKPKLTPTQLRMLHLFYRRYPAFCNASIHVPQNYAKLRETMCRMEQAGEIFIIAPHQPITVTRMEKDVDKLYALYVRGRRDAEAALPALRAYLNA